MKWPEIEFMNLMSNSSASPQQHPSLKSESHLDVIFQNLIDEVLHK